MLDVAAATDQALKLIRSAGSLRSTGLAAKLGMGQAELEDMLEHSAARHLLIRCAITRGDGRREIEYRPSVAFGGELRAQIYERSHRAPDPLIERLREWRAPRNESTAGQAGGPKRADTGAHPEADRDSSKESPATAPARPVDPQKEKQKMEALDQIEAAFKKHGAMGAAKLRDHVNLASLSYYLRLGASARPQRFAKLAGTGRWTIWGLPTQEAPKADALEAGAELGRKDDSAKPPRHIHRRKRAGGGVRCNAQTPREENQPHPGEG